MKAVRNKKESFLILLILFCMMFFSYPVLAEDLTGKRETFVPKDWESATNKANYQGVNRVDLRALNTNAHKTIVIPREMTDLTIIGGDKVFSGLTIAAEDRISDLRVIIQNLKLEAEGDELPGLDLTSEHTTTYLTLIGNNEIKSSKGAGVRVKSEAELVITSEVSGCLLAHGGTGAAGIGGQRGQSTGNIIIESGIITAEGGNCGAGIGGGDGGSIGNITITGGSIYAKGDLNTNDIGGGRSQETNGSVQIDGGYVFVGHGRIDKIVRPSKTGNVLFTFYGEDKTQAKPLCDKMMALKSLSDSTLTIKYKSDSAGRAYAWLPETSKEIGYYFETRIGNTIWDTTQNGLIGVVGNEGKKANLYLQKAFDIPVGAANIVHIQKENIIVPYSITNIAYELDLHNVLSITDGSGIIRSMYSTIYLDPPLGAASENYIHLNLKENVRAAIFTDESSSYKYDSSLSNAIKDTVNGGRIVCDESNKIIRIYYPKDTYTMQKFKVYIFIPTELTGIEANTYRSTYVKKSDADIKPKKEIKVDTEISAKAVITVNGIERTLDLDTISKSESITLQYNDFTKIK